MRKVRLGDKDYVVPDYATGRFIGFTVRHHWDLEQEGVFIVERWNWRTRWTNRLLRLWGKDVGEKSTVSFENATVSGPSVGIDVGPTTGIRLPLSPRL